MGIPASLRMRSPSCMLAAPNQAARMGLGVAAAKALISLAIAVGLVIAWGVMMTRRASTPRSSSTIAAALAVSLDFASPRTSTGLPCDQAGGSASLRRAIVSSDRRAGLPSAAIRASTAMTPGPPALVRIPSRSPRGIFFRPNSSATSKISLKSKTRAMPARRKAAS